MSMFDRAGTGLSEWLSGALNLAELFKGSTVSLAVTGVRRRLIHRHPHPARNHALPSIR
jgi:hypothetical protein